MQGTMTRVGSKMPFAQAVEEVWLNQQTEVTESTLRRVTERHGQAAEEIERAEVERLEKEMLPSKATPEQMMISADGAYIALTTGEWREIKTVVIGETESVWNKKKGKIEVKTKNPTYFSRSYRVREFERYALAELHRRGVFYAKVVAAPNDGSTWIQNFVDYHVPQAVRILDFSHASGYVANAGKVVWGEGTELFQQWFKRVRHQFKHKPPQHTLSDLRLLLPKTESDEGIAIIDTALHYLQNRLQQIDYPYFQARGLPIGSGSVESAHKVVVQSRMKQAGMRWAEEHIDPMLALRNLVCNGRWSQGWSQIVAHYWQQQHHEFREQSKRQRPYGSAVIFDSAPVAATPSEKCTTKAPNLAQVPETKNRQPYRPSPDHPWRNDIWPTKEAWRWS